jgi:spermidine synthase
MKYIEKLNKEVSIVRECKNVLVEGESIYQKYMICQTDTFGQIVVIEGDIQSTQNSEKQYHELLVHPAMLAHKNPETVLIMGGGEGATLREVLKYKSVKKVVMVDIDEEFVNVCKMYLPTFHEDSFNDERAEVLYEDINKYIDETKEKFDVVIGDLVDLSYDEENKIYKSFYDGKFYKKLKTILNGKYVIATQAGDLTKASAHKFIRDSIKEETKNIKTYGQFIPDFYAYWGYIIATDEELEIEEIIEKEYEKKEMKFQVLEKKDLRDIFNIPTFIEKKYKY